MYIPGSITARTKKEIEREINRLSREVSLRQEAHENDCDWEGYDTAKDVLLWVLHEIKDCPQDLKVVAPVLSWVVGRSDISPSNLSL